METYAQFLNFVCEQDPTKLLFLDECHFASKGTSLPFYVGWSLFMDINPDGLLDFHQAYGWSPAGQPLRTIQPGGLSPTFSITLMTNLRGDGPLMYWTAREATNSGEDFLKTLQVFARDGFFNPGDILVMDNARVHTSAAIQRGIQRILDEQQIEVVYLPTYSPELNPCELVFASFKKYIRSAKALTYEEGTNRPIYRPAADLVYEAAAAVTYDHMEAYYRHCRYLKPDSDVYTVLYNQGHIQHVQ